ncbi:MAG: CxxxxCH/CxxCH domain-containing protein [Geobacter sp.]|nr:CxxxxCH/CxxCH domain-containing protein [Geobacter sp.]
MKKNISLILLSLALLVVMPFSAFAIVAPHTNTTQVGCSSCHNATASAPTSFSNMCVTCHKPGSANVNVTAIFYQSDAANIYNRFNGFSSGIAPAKLKFTSHNWAGSEDAPQAGASRPTNVVLNPATLGTNLSCARCHNVHLARSSATNSAPFLRSLNDNDQMCRDCHRTRDTSSHLLGSHPVNFRYTSATSKAVTKPAEYFVPPRNANPANPTAAMKLVNGKILCTSCHAVHYADSNSGTVDGRSSWANLSSSRGMLLRTDTFGKTDAISSVNICTNCHNKPNHQTYAGSKTNSMPIQCVDCHSGHVEYLKPEDVALGGDYAKPNVYMLRRYVNYSAGIKLNSYRRKAFLTSTSSTATLANSGSGTAICQACHNLPTTVSDHSTATSKNECTVCHGSSLHAVEPPIGCTDCHGSPPQHTVAGTIKYGANPSKGYAVYSSINNTALITRSYFNSATYKNESTAGHPTHAAGKPYTFACGQCHNKTSATHYKQTYQDVPFTTPGILSPAAVFTPGNVTSTCSAAYCHSYGMATLTKSKTISWAAGVRGSIVNAGDNRCVSCHNGVNATYSNLSTNSHFRHVDNKGAGKVITCDVCHSATVSGNSTISNYPNHVNGVRDLSFSGSLATGTTFNGTTCTTYCHSNGSGTPAIVTPVWSDRNTGKCGTCHLTAVDTGSGIMSTGTHFTHISSTYGPKRNTNSTCNACHIFSTELASSHVDGSISKNSGANFCLNCHAQSTPVWTTPVRQTCQSCHSGLGTGSTESVANRSWSNYDATGVQAPFKSYSTFNNRGHGAFASIVCSNCHNANSKHIDGALTATGSYRGARIFSNLSGLDATYSADKLCIDCHNDVANGGRGIVTNASKMNFLSHVSERSVPTTSLCVSCHDSHGTSNKVMINKTFNVYTGNGRGAAVKTVNFTNMTTGFVNASRTGICQVCHTNTKVYRNYSSKTGVYVGTVTFSGSWGHMGNNKRCLTCHKHDASQFAFRVTGGGACNACHGYPPATNAHASHITVASAKPIADGFAGTTNNTMACGTCHFNGSQTTFDTEHTTSANASIDVQDSLKFNNTGTLDNSNYNPTFSCSNVSCHFKASPTWK